MHCEMKGELMGQRGNNSDIAALVQPLWKQTMGNSQIKIAILDGPVELEHPSLEGAQIVAHTKSTGAKGPAARHGTHIASIIFGSHTSGLVKGIAPRCTGIAISLFDDGSTLDPACTQSDIAAAINTALESGAQIINISAGQIRNAAKVDSDLIKAINKCEEQNVLVIAASGDAGCKDPSIPACLPTVLAIAADTHQSASSSTSDEHIKSPSTHCLAVPGKNVPGATPGGGTLTASGSSYAAAIATGIAALLMSIQVEKYGFTNITTVSRALTESAIWDSRQRISRLNVESAYTYIVRNTSIEPSIQREKHTHDSGTTSTQVHPIEHYEVSTVALLEKFQGVSRDKFGTVDIETPGRGRYNIRDLTYDLPTGADGMRLVPASDEELLTLRDGTTVPGWHVVDNILRNEMGLGENDPIYSIISYIHPEDHQTSIAQLAHTTKFTAGHRHIGAYHGRGRTTHGLDRHSHWRGQGPANMAFNVDRHPANLQVLSLHGVPQSTLNRNAQIVDLIVTTLGHTLRRTDTTDCRTVDISTILQYYRDLILGESYLEDLPWYTNCSSHKALVINIFMNLPHNEEAFRDTFGFAGHHLWIKFLQRYRSITGDQFQDLPRIDFVPLWRQQGLPLSTIQPLTLAEYNSYHAALSEGRLEEYTGRKPAPPNVALAWPLETLPVFLEHFLRTYVGIYPTNGVMLAGKICLMRQALEDRLGISTDQYMKFATTLMGLFVAIESTTMGTKDQALSWLSGAEFRLCEWIRNAQSMSGNPEKHEVSVKHIKDCVAQAYVELHNAARHGQSDASLIQQALNKRLCDQFEHLNDYLAPTGGRTGFFSTPGIIHQLSRGVHPSNSSVEISTVCTVMDSADLVPAGLVRFGSETDLSVQQFESSQHDNEEDFVDPQSSPPVVAHHTDSLTYHPASAGGPPVGTTHNDQPCGCSGRGVSTTSDTIISGDYVYALGHIGYDFRSHGRRDSMRQRMADGASPDNPHDMVAHLEEYPADAAALQWTLSMEGAPIYAIEPVGPFAAETFAVLRQFLRDHIEEDVERVSLPGTILGTAVHKNGSKLPVVAPELRGMYSWTTEAIVSTLTSDPDRPKDSDSQELRDGVRNFLERVYYELRNLGRDPWDRALNFAATNAFEVERVYEQAYRENMELDTIEVIPAVLHPGTSNHWDVKLTFFFPERTSQSVRKVYRFTVNVEDVVPATVGPMRSWFVR